MSVLPKNTQLVFSIRNYIRYTSEIFSISSLVKISLTVFLCFSFIFVFIFETLISMYKKKITRRLEHVYLLVEKRFFLLEDKLHMLAPSCNILYIKVFLNSKVHY